MAGRPRKNPADRDVVIETLQDQLMWERYQDQRSSAQRRRIGWEFSFVQWRAWWLEDDRWSRRGRHAGAVMMCRLADTGPYAPGNVYPGSPASNRADVPSWVHEAATAKRRATHEHNGTQLGQHLRDRERHPRAKPVTVHGVEYASAALAAEATGIPEHTIRRHYR